MVNFDDRSNRIPEPDPVSGILFSSVMNNPQAAQLIKAVIGDLSELVMKRGGRLNITTEGPEQGITVEADGEVFRITPCSSTDPEEAAIQNHEHRLIQDGKIEDPIAVHISTLRNLLIVDSKLKGR